MNYKLKENHLKKNLDKPGSWYIHFNFLFLTLGFITAPIDDALNYGKVNERTQPTGHGHRPATATATGHSSVWTVEQLQLELL